MNRPYSLNPLRGAERWRLEQTVIREARLVSGQMKFFDPKKYRTLDMNQGTYENALWKDYLPPSPDKF